MDFHSNIRLTYHKINWPVEDVVKNVNYFLATIKRATGNTKEVTEEKSKSIKPSMCRNFS